MTDGPAHADVRSGRWRWLPTIPIVAYLLVQAWETVLLRFDGPGYMDLQRWWGTPPGRMAAAVTVVAIIWHGSFGLASAYGAMTGAPRLLDEPRARAMVLFVVMALSLPAVMLTMWPWLSSAL